MAERTTNESLVISLLLPNDALIQNFATSLSSAVAPRMTSRSVADIIKEMAQRIGLDASTFPGHSLRSGFLTSAASNGASIFKMMDVSRHRSIETLRGYVRDSDLFKDHAGSGLL